MAQLTVLVERMVHWLMGQGRCRGGSSSHLAFTSPENPTSFSNSVYTYFGEYLES